MIHDTLTSYEIGKLAAAVCGSLALMALLIVGAVMMGG